MAANVIHQHGLQWLIHGEFDLLGAANDFADELRDQGYRVRVIPLSKAFMVYSNGGGL